MKGRVIFPVSVIAVTLVWVVTRGLSGSLVYFVTPTELLERDASVAGERFRLGGQVVPGSTETVDGGVRFIVTDGATRITVVNTSDPPALFRAGIGVVVEGTLGDDGVFRSDSMLIKHSEEYRPPSPGERPSPMEIG